MIAHVQLTEVAKEANALRVMMVRESLEARDRRATPHAVVDCSPAGEVKGEKLGGDFFLISGKEHEKEGRGGLMVGSQTMKGQIPAEVTSEATLDSAQVWKSLRIPRRRTRVVTANDGDYRRTHSPHDRAWARLYARRKLP